MEFNFSSTQSWNRTFNVWIEDIQVQFQPVVRIALKGGLLRRVRRITHFAAPLLTLFFSLHCTKPRVVATRSDAWPEDRSPENKAPENRKPVPGIPKVKDKNIHTETGKATWYGSEMDHFSGKPTASGELMDPDQLTCAHRTLPMGSLVEVENLDNGRRATLRVNDRGPFVHSRILDVSRRAAIQLDFMARGTASVRIQAVQEDEEPTEAEPVVETAKPYTIQVAALGNPTSTKRLFRELKTEYKTVTVLDAVAVDGRSVKQVQVGSYSTFEEAERAANKLSKRFGDRGVEPFITRRR